MDTLHLIGTVTGLGFLAGIRLYATVLTLGLAIRFQWIRLPQEYQGLEVLASWWIIGVAGMAFLIEFIADKIPWVDSLWDSVHTFVRPLGAAWLGISALGETSSGAGLAIGLLTGGAALASHSTKAAVRLAVNQSPEPVSNSIMSLAGDVVVPAGVWLVWKHPLVAGALVLLFVAAAAFLAPRFLRLLRGRARAAAAWWRSLFASPAPPVPR